METARGITRIRVASALGIQTRPTTAAMIHRGARMYTAEKTEAVSPPTADSIAEPRLDSYVACGIVDDRDRVLDHVRLPAVLSRSD